MIGDAAGPRGARSAARDGYDRGPGTGADSPKARMAASMEHYVAHFEQAPVVVLPLLQRYRAPIPTEGASVYPACQNLLLAARALGYGGVLTVFHALVDNELHALLGIPDDVFIAATITLGRRRATTVRCDGARCRAGERDRWGQRRRGPSTRPAPATPAPVHHAPPGD